MDARTLCLGIINENPASGYDIKKAVEQGPFQHFFGISFGSIYPTLNRLLDDGHITTVDDNGSLGGHPSKRRFTTTDQGKLAFCEQLAAFDTRDKMRSEFVLALYFINELDLPTRITMLDKRLVYLRHDLDEISCRANDMGCESVPGALRDDHLDDKAAILGFAHAVRSAEISYLSDYRDSLANRLAAADEHLSSNKNELTGDGANRVSPQPELTSELETV